MGDGARGSAESKDNIEVTAIAAVVVAEEIAVERVAGIGVNRERIEMVGEV